MLFLKFGNDIFGRMRKLSICVVATELGSLKEIIDSYLKTLLSLKQTGEDKFKSFIR